MGFWPARWQSRPKMSGDQPKPYPPEATGAASAAAPAGRPPGVEHASALVEAWTAVGRWAAVAGGVAEAALLLAARIWLSQTIFVHQIMMMMRAEGFSAAPPVGATLIQSIAPLLLAAGLVTRPVAMLLLLGLGQDPTGTHLAGPQAVLLIWLTIGGAGPLSLDHLLRGGLSRVPVWALRWVTQLYASSDALGEIVLPLGTRVFLAIVIASGAGFASWLVPFTGELVTAPWWTLLLCWGLLLGLGTRPAAIILCAVAPPIVIPGAVLDRFEVALLLLLLAAKGAGRLSLDSAVTCIADSYLRMPSRDQPVPHVVVVGGGFGGIAAVRGLRWTACRITLIDRRNHYLFQPLLYQPISHCPSEVSFETSAT